MKKQISYFWRTSLVALTFIGGIILSTSCSKQEPDLSRIEKKVIEKRKDSIICDSSCFEHFKMKVVNNTLEFPDVLEYEKAISYLVSLDDKSLLNWPASVGFISMRCFYGDEFLNEVGFEDEILTTLLNPEGALVIEDYYYVIYQEKVYVISKEDFKKKNSFMNVKSKVFDVDQDVIGYMKGEIIEGDALKGCDSNNSGWNYFYLTGGSVQYRARYYKAGIYFSLRALMEKNGTGIEMQMGTTSCSKSFYKNSKTCAGNLTPANPIGGNSNSYSWRPYSSVRPLSAYRMSIWYMAYDLHAGGGAYEDGQIMIRCNEGEDCSN